MSVDRLTLAAENRILAKGLRAYGLANLRPPSLSLKAVDRAIRAVRCSYEMLKNWQETGHESPSSASVPEGYIEWMMTASPASVVEKYSRYDIEYPLLYVIYGSCARAVIVSSYIVCFNSLLFM